MKPQKFEIMNGVTLNIITTEKFKTAQLSVNFLYPLKEESSALNALLPMVMLRGTRSYPSIAKISERLQNLYSASIYPTNYKRGETQIFGLCANFIDNSYSLDDTDIVGGVLYMLREMIFSPCTEGDAFISDFVEGEKSNLTDKINAQINNKNSYALIRCREEMCRGEAYGISEFGTPDTVTKIGAQELYLHYKRLLYEAPIEIFYVGPQTGEALLTQIKEMFARLPARRVCGLHTEVVRSAGEVREVIEHGAIAQAKLSIGFRTGSALSDMDYYKFSAFCELYGSGTTSKLFMNVREKLSLCYYCQAVPEAHKGIMIVASGIEADRRDQAQKEILAQLDAVKNGDISDDELEGAIKSLSSDYRCISDSADSMEAWYLSRRLAGRDDSPEEAAQAISEVTKDDIAKMAQKLTLDTVYLLCPDETEVLSK